MGFVLAWSMQRAIQRLHCFGREVSVLFTTSSTRSSPMRRGGPERGASLSPCKRIVRKRSRHLHTVAPVTPSRSATSLLLSPQPMFPMRPGIPERQTHDYKRHGVTSLFAALDVAPGKIIGSCHRRHRHEEFLRFLRKIDAEVPVGMDVHLVLDNYATHKQPLVQRWFARHPRFILHFTPTSASWLNQVERFFAEITRRRIRRGTFTSVPNLERAINEYLAHHNANATPFTWTATADSIFGKIAKICSTNL